MNLIEQLGGYEKAKEITEDDFFKCFTHVSLNGKRGINGEFSFIPHLNEALKEMVRISDIKEALLEYRRQHNIYEVGDKVITSEFNCICEVVGLCKLGGDQNIFIDVYGDTSHENTSTIRHATPEEIAAGRRLP